MTWWDGFCWIIYLSNEKKSPWLLKFRLYIEGYTIPFANRVYYTPLWESPQKNSQDSRESNKFLCFFSWLTCYTPENGGEHIFLTYPRDPDSPCQRMIGVYNHLSKVCRFHYQSQKGNWIPRAIWIPLISGWWFQICLIFTPIWGRFPILTHIFQMGWNHQLVFFMVTSW